MSIPPVSITIRSPDPNLQLHLSDVERTKTVGELKVIISEKLAGLTSVNGTIVTVSNQRLLFMGRVLENRQHLTEIIPGLVPKVDFILAVAPPPSPSAQPQPQQPSQNQTFRQTSSVSPSTSTNIPTSFGPSVRFVHRSPVHVPIPQETPPEIHRYLTRLRDALAAKHDENVAKKWFKRRRQSDLIEAQIPVNYLPFLNNLGPAGAPQTNANFRFNRQHLRVLVGFLFFSLFVTTSVGFSQTLSLVWLLLLAGLLFLVVRFLIKRNQRMEGGRRNGFSMFVNHFLLFIESLLPGFTIRAPPQRPQDVAPPGEALPPDVPPVADEVPEQHDEAQNVHLD
ncbi:hypothetical protein RCL1_003470 [Eukaryota sp. TZLM3-RCL]